MSISMSLTVWKWTCVWLDGSYTEMKSVRKTENCWLWKKRPTIPHQSPRGYPSPVASPLSNPSTSPSSTSRPVCPGSKKPTKWPRGTRESRRKRWIRWRGGVRRIGRRWAKMRSWRGQKTVDRFTTCRLYHLHTPQFHWGQRRNQNIRSLTNTFVTHLQEQKRAKRHCRETKPRRHMAQRPAFVDRGIVEAGYWRRLGHFFFSLTQNWWQRNGHVELFCDTTTYKNRERTDRRHISYIANTTWKQTDSP